jgi:hypothetical protein
VDRRSIVLYLAKKGLVSAAISEDLVATLGAEAISYPWVTRDFREAKFATSSPEVIFSELTHEHDDCNEAILLAFDDQPFASMRQLVRLTHLPKATVHQRL